MPTTRRRILAAALCSPALALTGCTDDTTPTATRYDTAVRRVMALYRTPGALASVRVPGEEEWRQAYGYADVATRRPLDFADHFSIRSVTKSYTVTLILQLVRDQALTLDDKLDRFVTGIPNGHLITIADLAGMQSGIADYSASEQFLKDFGSDFTRPFTQEQLVAYAVPASPRFAPGAQYEYSNTNTVLLGMIVEKLTGLTMAQALGVRILGPLGLRDTSYPYVAPLPAPHPTPYDTDIGTGVAEPVPLITPTSLAASGAMVSTLDDMQAWGQALGDGRLIGAALQQERVSRARAVTNGPEYDAYGLGIGILDGWWGHTGTGIGFQAATFYDPRTHATIAVLVNSTPGGGGKNLNVAEQIFVALADVVATR
jgi:D-alanyl-D-alanine carboxypeptidase